MKILKSAMKTSLYLLTQKGKSLLSGKAYCGHCGSKLNLTTSGRYRKRKDGTIDDTKRIRYVCYGKSRKQTDCDR